MFIDTQTFSVPTSSHKTLLDELDLRTAADDVLPDNKRITCKLLTVGVKKEKTIPLCDMTLINVENESQKPLFCEREMLRVVVREV